MTLIAEYHGTRETTDGKQVPNCVGRCTAKCYNATTKNCTCICGGVNHGVGLRRAKENIIEMFDEISEKYVISDECRQLPLFQ